VEQCQELQQLLAQCSRRKGLKDESTKKNVVGISKEGKGAEESRRSEAEMTLDFRWDPWSRLKGTKDPPGISPTGRVKDPGGNLMDRQSGREHVRGGRGFHLLDRVRRRDGGGRGRALLVPKRLWL